MNSVTTLYQELYGIEWGSYDPAGTLKEGTIRALALALAMLWSPSTAPPPA